MSKNVWKGITDKQIDLLEKHWAQQQKDILEALNALDLRGNSVLDIGCGTGQFFDYLCGRFGKYTGMDSSKAMLERLRKEHPIKAPHSCLVGDVFELQKDTRLWDGFDTVFCFSLMIHFDIDEVPKALNNLAAVARKNVVFNVYVTSGPTVQIPNISMGSSILFINSEDLAKMLKEFPSNDNWRFVQVGSAREYNEILYTHWIYNIGVKR